VTRRPKFEELVGADVEPDEGERERLRRVHDLLVAAGPPPELSPELEAGPDMRVTFRHRPRARGRVRRSVLLAAAALVAAAAFLAGYISGNDTSSQAFPVDRKVEMHATASAPQAHATLVIGPRDSGGNWPMKIAATGLPQLAKGDYYVLYLTRRGKIVGPCGGFFENDGAVVAYLNAPYRLKGAGWIVTRVSADDHRRGPAVLTT
jgi:hypothetical protein